jgi:hypothetical protein
MANDLRFDLLLKEIKDPYVQENFRKLKRYLERIDGGFGGTQTINQTTVSGGGVSIWERTSKQTITPSQTKTVDIKTLSQFSKAAYMVTIQQGNNTLSFNVSLINDDSNLCWEIYGIVGCLDIQLNFNNSGGQSLLDITNNETGDITVILEKLTTPK